MPRIHPEFKIQQTPSAQVTQSSPATWRLEIPAGPRGTYRLAQIDDYAGRRRSAFPWQPPLHLQLRARASGNDLPGTWGFGLWNDPFGMALVRGPEMLRLPVLPNALWFFFCSPENYLSIRDDLPASGNLAAAFTSPRLPGLLSILVGPALPFLLVRPLVRLARRLGRLVVKQASAQLSLDVTDWHTYALEWRQESALWRVDGKTVLEASPAPGGPLGLVLWIDNQYAALRPDGRIGFGTLQTPDPAWIEINEILLDKPAPGG